MRNNLRNSKGNKSRNRKKILKIKGIREIKGKNKI